MRISKLIETLQKAQQTHGDLPIHFVGGVSEFIAVEVVFVKAGTSLYAGAATGPHLHEPDRVVIKGVSI